MSWHSGTFVSAAGMEVNRYALVLTTWGSFVTLIVLSIVVASIHSEKIGEDNAACCKTSKRWRFVPIPEQWSRRTRHVTNALLLIMAIFATLAQAVVIALEPASETLALLAAYNIVNFGFVLSFWAGDAFPYVQAVSVGSGSMLMWAATIFESYYTGENPDRDPNRAGLGLFLLWGLAGTSFVDFTFYVVLKFCCASNANPALQAQLVAPLPAKQAETPGSPKRYMYSLDDERFDSESETDVTNANA